VTVCGTVVQVGRAHRSRSGVHRSVIVDAGGNDRIEVDVNLDVMGNVPFQRGEAAIVHGEYYYDRSGRDGVHWTHRTLRGSHPPGYIILAGTTYQ
jgi:hypothetical protein